MKGFQIFLFPADLTVDHREAENLPKKCEKRWRAEERAKNWYRKMVKAQIERDRLQKGEEELNDSGRQTDSHLN